MTSSRWIVLPAAVAAGALWALAFGEQPRLLIGWLGLVPLALLLGAPRPAWAGFAFGFGYWMGAIPWIAHTLRTYGGTPVAGAVLLLALLAAYLAVYPALFAALGARLYRLAVAPAAGGWRQTAALMGLPALWVGLEALRGVALTGFPWNLAAHGWLAIPGALPLASFVGVWGVSFLVAVVGVSTALGLARREATVGVVGWLVVLLALAVGARFGAGNPDLVSPGDDGPWMIAGRTGAPTPGQPVRIVQPNIPNLTTFDPTVTIAHLERLFAQSEAACDQPGALVLWPESAAWPYVYGEDPYLDQRIAGLAKRGCTVVLNAPRREGEAMLNAALLVDGEGLRAVAGKRHLVPFGEYVPLADWFPFIGRLARAAGDFSPAEEIVLLPWGRERLGAAVCFEVIFPGEVGALVDAGATTLVTITNDAWYGDTAAPWQHLAAARFRAAELRRPLLRAAITGVSAAVSPTGAVLAQVGVGESGTLRLAVRGRRDRSPFSRAPWLVPVLSVVVAVGAISWARRAPDR
jgi:apolipoprotein N-acyltransferase